MPQRDRNARKSPLNQDPEAVRWAMSRSRMNQRQLATAIKRSESYVSEILGGTRNAPPDVLADIADAFNCPISMLEPKRVSA